MSCMKDINAYNKRGSVSQITCLLRSCSSASLCLIFPSCWEVSQAWNLGDLFYLRKNTLDASGHFVNGGVRFRKCFNVYFLSLCLSRLDNLRLIRISQARTINSDRKTFNLYWFSSIIWSLYLNSDPTDFISDFCISERDKRKW